MKMTEFNADSILDALLGKLDDELLIDLDSLDLKLKEIESSFITSLPKLQSRKGEFDLALQSTIKIALQNIERSIENVEGEDLERERISVTARKQLEESTQLDRLLAGSFTDLQSLSAVQTYMTHVNNLEVLCCRAKEFIVDRKPVNSEELAKAVEIFTALTDMQSKGHNPRQIQQHRRFSKLIDERIQFLAQNLKSVSMELLQSESKALGWPSSHDTFTVESTSASLVNRFDSVFLQCMGLQSSLSKIIGEPALHELWSLEALLKPLTNRFRFHFCRGVSETNRLDKPEWYLSNTVEVIKRHIDFTGTHVQSLVNSYKLHSSTSTHNERSASSSVSAIDVDGTAPVDVENRFISALVTEVREKVRSDMALINLSYSDSDGTRRDLLLHLLDELIDFEKSLASDFSYLRRGDDTSVHTVHAFDAVLDSESSLRSWFEADAESSIHRLETMLGADDAFSVTASPLGLAGGGSSYIEDATAEVWSRSATTLASDFTLSLVSSLLDRCCVCSLFNTRLEYISRVIQPLLVQFYETIVNRSEMVRLGGVRAVSPSPLALLAGFKEYIALHNSICHVSTMLQSWTDDRMEVIELSAFQAKLAASGTTATSRLAIRSGLTSKPVDDDSALIPTAASSVIGPSRLVKSTTSYISNLLSTAAVASEPARAEARTGSASPTLASAAKAVTKVDDLLATSTAVSYAGVFSNEIGLLEEQRVVMLNNEIGTISKQLRIFTRLYLLKSFELEDDYCVTGVSSELADALSYLHAALALLASTLTGEVFDELTRLLAVRLNRLLFNDLIVSDHSLFSATGAEQLTFDMRAIFTLFSPYVVSTAENLFAEVSEACKLLALPVDRCLSLYNGLVALRVNNSVATEYGDDAASRWSDEEKTHAVDMLAASNIKALSPFHAYIVCSQRKELFSEFAIGKDAAH